MESLLNERLKGEEAPAENSFSFQAIIQTEAKEIQESIGQSGELSSVRKKEEIFEEREVLREKELPFGGSSKQSILSVSFVRQSMPLFSITTLPFKFMLLLAPPNP